MATPHIAHDDRRPEAHEGTPGAGMGLTPGHLARLLELSRALAGACDHTALAVIAAERARDLTGASWAQVIGLRDDGAAVVLAEASEAAAGSRLEPGGSRATGPAPEHVLRAGEPLWLGSRAEAVERWPDLPLDVLAAGPHGAWAFLPLAADDETTGVLALAFDRAQPFDAVTRTFLAEVAAACGAALARGSLFTRARARANASDAARAACELRQRRTDAQVVHRTHLYERERFARARAEAETAAHAAPSAFLVEYEEIGVDGPVSRLLGVFSSEASARAAVHQLDRARSLIIRASISAWTLDAIHPRTSVDIDLSP